MMQKRSFRKIIFIGVFLILFLLLLGGNVKAEEVNDVIGTGYVSIGNSTGDTATITYGGAIWGVEIILKDNGKPGVAALTLKDVTGSEVRVPNAICKDKLIGSNVYGVVLKENSFSNATNLSKINVLYFPNDIIIEESTNINPDGTKSIVSYTDIISKFTKNCSNLYMIEKYDVGRTYSHQEQKGTETRDEAGNTTWSEDYTKYFNMRRTFTAENGVLFSTYHDTIENIDKNVLISYPAGKSLGVTSNIYTIPDEVIFKIKNEETGVVQEIPYKVTTIGSNAFYNTKVGAVTLSTYITEIKASAFEKSKINTLDMQKATSLAKIGDSAFAYTMLGNVTFPGSITNLGIKIFEGCSSLQSVTFNDATTVIGDGVLPGYMFQGCTTVSSINLGNRFIKIGDLAFAGCISLTKVNMPSVKEIGTSAFSACTSLRSINLFNVTSIGNNAFSACKVLGTENDGKAIELNLSNVVTIGDSSFEGCSGLKAMKFSNTSLKTIGNNAFAGIGITNMVVPQSVTSIGNNAFSNCKNLKTIILPGATVGQNVFSECTASELVVYCTDSSKESVSGLGTISYIVYSIENNKALIKEADVKATEGKVTILNYIYGYPVTIIGEGAFKDCTKMVDIKLPSTLTTIERQAFMGCTGLTTITIPKSVETIGAEAFKGCKNLEKVVIEKGSQLRSIGENAFEGCNQDLIIYYSDNNQTIINYPGVVRVGNDAPQIEAYVKIVPSGATITGYIRDRIGVGINKYAITTENNINNVSEDEWEHTEDTTFVNIIPKEFSKNGIVYIYAMDFLGNYNTYLLEIEGIDEIRPQIKSVSSKNKRGITTLSLKLSDEGGSNLARYAVSTSPNVENVTEWIDIGGNKSEGTFDWQITKNGRFYIYVQDGAGNLTKGSGSNSGAGGTGGGETYENWNLDTDSPWVQEAIVYTETGRIIATFRDIGSGLAVYAIDTNENTDENTEWIEIPENTYILNIEKIIEIGGTYYIHLMDDQGNEGLTELNEINTKDKTAPRIVFGDKTNDVVEVVLEDGSGVNPEAKIKYAYSLYNTKPSDDSFRTAIINNNDGKTYFDAYGRRLNGAYYLWVKVESLVDSEGNEYDTTKLAVSDKTYKFSTTKLQVASTLDYKTVKEMDIATYTLSFDEPVELVKDIDIERASGIGSAQYIAEYSGSNYVWKIKITAGKGNGTIGFKIPAEMFKSCTTGNTFSKDVILEDILKIDNESPTVTFENLDKSFVKEDGEVVYTVTTSEPVKVSRAEVNDILVEQTSGDFLICNDARVEKSPEDKEVYEGGANYGTKWLITIVGGEGDGEVFLKLPEGLFRDIVDNQSKDVEIRNGNLTFDNTSPKVEALTEPMSKFIDKSKTIEFYLTLNEEVNYKATARNITTKVGNNTNNDAKITIEPENASEINSLTKRFKISVENVTGDGLVKITIPKEHFTDVAGNELEQDVIITDFSADNSGPRIGTVEKTKNESNTEWTMAVQVSDSGIGLDKYVLSEELDASKINAAQWKTITEEEKTANKIDNIKINVKALYYLYVKDILGNISSKVIDATTLTDVVPPEVKTISEPSVKNVNSSLESSFDITMNEEVNFTNSLEDITIIVGDEILKNVMVLTEPTEIDGPTVIIESNKTDKTKVRITFKGLTGNGIAKIIIPKEYFADQALNTMKNVIQLDGITVDNTKATKLDCGLSKNPVNSTSIATYVLTMTEPVEYDVNQVKNIIVSVVNPLTGTTIEKSAIVEIPSNGLTEKVNIRVKGLMGNGEATLKIPEGFFKDKAGNLTDEILIEGLIVDNAGPKGSFERISKTLTKSTDAPIIYTIKTDEPAILNTKINPVIDSGVYVGPACKNIKIEAANTDGTKWTITLTECTGDGEVSLVLPKGLFTDALGNESEYTKISDGKLVFDNTKPKVTSITEPTTTFVNSNTTLEFTATMSEEIIYQKTSRDIEVKVGEQVKPATILIEPILASDADMLTTDKFRIKITVKDLVGDGEAIITIPKEYFKDIVGNELNEDIRLDKMTVDNVIPTIESKSGPNNTFVNAKGISEYTITISEPVIYAKTDREIVTTVNSQAITDANIKIILDSVNKRQVKIVVTGLTGNGASKIVIPKEYFKDAAGNTVYTDIELTGITVDNVSPIVKVDYAKTANGIKVTITGNEDLQLPDNTWTLKNPFTLEKEFTSDFYSQMDIKDLIGNIAKTEVNAVFTTGIYMAETEGEIVVSRTKQLKIDTTPAKAPFKDVVWTSDNEDIASVNANGLVTAKKLGEATITATLTTNKEVKATFKVKVVERAIKSITVLEKPTKLQYVKGESLDLTGGKITITYNDESTETRSMNIQEVEVTGFDNTKIGDQTLTVTYEKQTTTFNVNVIPKELTNISIKTLPNVTTYVQNTELKLDGGILLLTYNDKKTEEIPLTTKEIIITGFDTTKLGKQKLSVVYQGKETTFDIEVVSEETKITIEFKKDCKYSFADSEYIVNIAPKTTIKDFLANITTDGEIKVYEKTKLVEGTDEIIKTGMEIVITKGTNTKTYKLVVLGDVNGSGTVNVADMTTMMMHIAETLAVTPNTTKILTGAYLKAANINSDAKITIADLTSLMKIIAENK